MRLTLKQAQALTSTAKKKGADEAEIFASESRTQKIDVLDGKIEASDNLQTGGMAVRVIKDKRSGFAYTAEIEEDAFESAIDHAIENSKTTARDENLCFAEPKTQAVKLSLVDKAIDTTDIRKKADIALQIETSARSFDPRVKITEKISYDDTSIKTIIVNSRGVAVEYEKTVFGAYADVIAVDKNIMESGSWAQYCMNLEDLNAELIGLTAAKKAVEMLGGTAEKSGMASVIFSPNAATTLLAALAPALSAESVQKGKSLFANAVDKPVASRKLTLIDSGILPDQVGSVPYDDEGTLTGELVLINEGFLKGFLYDPYTAKKGGKAPTGNSFRMSFMSTPSISPTNLYIKPQLKAPDELMNGMNKGFLVETIMGAHTINPVSGDFSVGFAGMLIENGKPSRPVKGMTISGNIMDILSHVEDIGSDLHFFPQNGNTGSPSLLIANLSVSGS
jgi:PmbA protein